MIITSQMVKDLRDKTSAGMMDCKKALTETNGDMEKANDLLRQKGLAVAAKRAGRATSQGVIETYIHAGGKLGVMVEIDCETEIAWRVRPASEVPLICEASGWPNRTQAPNRTVGHDYVVRPA